MGSSPPSILKIAIPLTPRLLASAILSAMAEASLNQTRRNGFEAVVDVAVDVSVSFGEK